MWDVGGDDELLRVASKNDDGYYCGQAKWVSKGDWIIDPVKCIYLSGSSERLVNECDLLSFPASVFFVGFLSIFFLNVRCQDHYIYYCDSVSGRSNCCGGKRRDPIAGMYSVLVLV